MEYAYTILAQHHGDELFYVIAVLILSVAGAVFDKIKKKMAGTESERREISPPLPRPPISETPTPRIDRPITRKSGPQRVPPPVPAKRTAPPTPPVSRPVQRPQTSPLPGRQIKVEVRRVEQPPTKVTISTPAELVAQAMRIQKPAEIVAPQAVQQVQNVRTVTARVPEVSAHPATAFRDMSASDWRRAIVLTEILGPPLAIREYESL